MQLLAKLLSLGTSLSLAGKGFYLLLFSLVLEVITLNLFQTKLPTIKLLVPGYRFALHNKHFHVVQGAFVTFAASGAGRREPCCAHCCVKRRE